MEQQVERYGSHHVNQEPALEVVQRDLTWMADHFIFSIHVSGAEVDDNVNDEYDIHSKINDGEWILMRTHAAHNQVTFSKVMAKFSSVDM